MTNKPEQDKSLQGIWCRFKTHTILSDLPSRFNVVTEGKGKPIYPESDGMELFIKDPTKKVSLFQRKLEGWDNLDKDHIIRQLSATVIRHGAGFVHPKQGGPGSDVVEEQGFYSIALDRRGFYGQFRNRGPVFLGDAESIRTSAQLRTRVKEHIKNERDGRKSLLSWAKDTNPYIK